MIQEEDEFETEWTRIDGKSRHQLICSWRVSTQFFQAHRLEIYQAIQSLDTLGKFPQERPILNSTLYLYHQMEFNKCLSGVGGGKIRKK